MTFQAELLRGCREAMGNFHQRWTGTRLTLFEPTRRSWQLQCGEGRFDVRRRNAAYAKRSGVALNFEIRGSEDLVAGYSFCVAWVAAGWTLMFHRDPARAAWPAHPEHHLQVDGPEASTQRPPFVDWRIPFGETKPERLLEYIASRIT